MVKMVNNDGRHEWCEKCMEPVQPSAPFVLLYKALSTGETWLIWFWISELLFNNEGH
jgi:hypothetical protein